MHVKYLKRRGGGMTRQMTAIIKRKGRGYIALCPQLDISSQGETIEQAKGNLREQLELFIESVPPDELKRHLDQEVFVTSVDVSEGEGERQGVSSGDTDSDSLSYLLHGVTLPSYAKTYPDLDKIAKLIPKDVTDDRRESLLSILKAVSIISEGLLLTKEAKNAYRTFKKHIDNALKTRNEFSLPNLEGKNGASYPLKELFPDTWNVGGEVTEGCLGLMSRIVGFLIGESKPILYPRLRIIDLTLTAWTFYTGKEIRHYAQTPNSYTKKISNLTGEEVTAKKDTTPYGLCRIMLHAIEGKDPGDFHRLFERVAKQKSPKKASINTSRSKK